MRKVSLRILAASLLVTSAAFGQAINTPSASLVVDQNSVGAFPLTASLGQLDPNILDIAGKPNASYMLLAGVFDPGIQVVGLGTLHVRLDLPYFMLQGSVGASGSTTIYLPPHSLDSLPVGTSFTLQAVLADATTATHYRLSGATQVTVVPFLSAPLKLSSGAGATAAVIAPVSNVTTNSISVGAVTFDVLPTTTLNGFSNLSSINVGQWVSIDGAANTTGGFDAIKIQKKNAQGTIRLYGMVGGVGVSGFDMLGVSVFVSNSTVFTHDNNPVDFTLVTPGIFVDAFIPVSSNLFPAANLVELHGVPENEPQPDDVDPNSPEGQTPPPCYYCGGHS